MEEELVIESSKDIINNFKKLSKVKSFIISRCGLICIPSLIVNLNQMTSLDLSSNPIKSIESLWSSYLPNLKILNLSACWLKRLPIGCPSFGNSLHSLFLNGNFLEKDPPNFSIFSNLKCLYLVGNDFVDVPCIPKSLETLDFRMNSFENLPESSLQVFDGSYCSLSIHFNIFSHQLTSLNLSHVGIFGDFIVPPLPVLSYLYLQHNTISKIVFQNSRRIIELDLSYNALSEFPSSIIKLPLLRILSLSHNAISTIPRDLSVLKHVESLDLSHNLLITPRLILPPRISSLRISFNFSVAFEIFPPSLKELDASFCSTATVPPLSTPLQSLALFFVAAIAFSDRLKPIADEPIDNVDGAIAPFSSFRGSKRLDRNNSTIGVHTLMNDRLSENIGCSATSGRSTKYEDNFLCLEYDGVTFVGVFDGHVGHEAAYVSAETFSTSLGPIVTPAFSQTNRDLKRAIRRSFCLVNDELRRRNVKDGTTAVIIGVKSNKGVCGHLGDSLALLVTKETSIWLTSPHRPTEKTEYAKLRRSNKSVASDWRVDGKLGISRSLGDFWCCDGMFDTPDVKVFDIPNNALSIVLGCDGLWDYIDEGVVCTIIRNVRDPVKASHLLQDYAFASGSHDNISLIVYNLNR